MALDSGYWGNGAALDSGYWESGKDTNVITNADHIRSMTDEELAEFLHTSFSCYGCPARLVCESVAGLDCDDIVADWLKQPYKEDT